MRAAGPDVEVIDAGADPPSSDLRADVLFGGWGPHSLEYAQHVDWVHLAGTGIDSYPREMFDGRIVDRKSTRLNSSHLVISYAVFCLKKKKKQIKPIFTLLERSHQIFAP